MLKRNKIHDTGFSLSAGPAVEQCHRVPCCGAKVERSLELRLHSRVFPFTSTSTFNSRSPQLHICSRSRIQNEHFPPIPETRHSCQSFTMARLSAEHFRSNVAMSTPISTRTSGRFRDIFKPHRSTSSVSPKTLTKSPPVAFEAVDSPSSNGDYFQAVAQPSVRKVDDEVETSAETKGSMSESNQAAFGAFGGVQASGGVMLDQIVFDNEPDRKIEVEGAGALSSSTPVQGILSRSV